MTPRALRALVAELPAVAGQRVPCPADTSKAMVSLSSLFVLRAPPPAYWPVASCSGWAVRPVGRLSCYGRFFQGRTVPCASLRPTLSAALSALWRGPLVVAASLRSGRCGLGLGLARGALRQRSPACPARAGAGLRSLAPVAPSVFACCSFALRAPCPRAGRAPGPVAAPDPPKFHSLLLLQRTMLHSGHGKN